MIPLMWGFESTQIPRDRKRNVCLGLGEEDGELALSECQFKETSGHWLGVMAEEQYECTYTAYT